MPGMGQQCEVTISHGKIIVIVGIEMSNCPLPSQFGMLVYPRGNPKNPTVCRSLEYFR